MCINNTSILKNIWARFEPIWALRGGSRTPLKMPKYRGQRILLYLCEYERQLKYNYGIVLPDKCYMIYPNLGMIGLPIADLWADGGANVGNLPKIGYFYISVSRSSRGLILCRQLDLYNIYMIAQLTFEIWVWVRRNGSSNFLGFSTQGYYYCQSYLPNGKTYLFKSINEIILGM